MALVILLSFTFIVVSLDAATAAGFVATNIGIARGRGLKHSHYRHHRNQFPQSESLHKDIRHCGRVTNPWDRYLYSSPPNTGRRMHLASTSSLAPNIVAGSTLVLSSLSGILFERNISKSSGGHVVTLLMAALISNTSRVVSRMIGVPIFSVPNDHVLYEWCWSMFLPASLVLALLSSSPAPASAIPDESSYDSEPNRTSNKPRPVKDTILGMALPFAAGTIGSIIGCLASFRFVTMPCAKHTTALLAGCLCASYIGGTVNFFATAKLLKDSVGGSDAGIGSAFGSMAAADLVVMAFYFAMLSAASKSSWLHRLFPSKLGDGTKVMEISRNELYSENATGESQFINIQSTTRTSTWSTITAILLASSMAVVSVFAATHLEQKVTSSFPPPFNPPGTMCAFLAAIGLLLEWLIGLTLSHNKLPLAKAPFASASISTHVSNSLQKISVISPTLSNICFYLLFAAVGTTADLSSAISGGPTALAFASLALIVHAISVILVTSSFIRLGKLIGVFYKTKMGISNKFHPPNSSWQEVLVASNAAIGGPSTAAAFAAGLLPMNGHKMTERDRTDTHQYRSALVIAATFWGVFGYAIATGIGVAVSRILMH